MLKVKNVSKSFGALKAVDGVSFEVHEKEIVGIIGPNGSGKTTLFNLIMGVYSIDGGRIEFQGKDITKYPPHKRCHLGLGRVHQIPRPFLKTTVIENVICGYLYGRGGKLHEAKSAAQKYLEYVGLAEKSERLSSTLNVLERKLLEIARCLAAGCKCILLDEPLSGLNPTEILHAEKMIRNLRDVFGLTVLWVEHIMASIKRVAERVIVMNHGQKIAEGSFEEISRNQDVINAYLGEK
ncbi:MAG: ABC transporter ATP-binding protein, partial [Candidatus Bathyarchaeia archaeon]